MGSMISLGLGRLEVDWGKNNFFINHSKLFLPGDIAPAIYYYAEGHQETQSAFVRKLRSVIKRLELLGYTMDECRRHYEESAELLPDYYPDPEISFDMLRRALRSVDVTRMLIPQDSDYDLGEFAARAILSDPEFTKTEAELTSLTEYDGTFFENLGPYVILRLLGENPNNLDQEVVWCYQDVVDGGWAEESRLYEGLSDADRYLIVTEGSSDASILRSALPLVEPDVADFFDFVDMTENYPFTGTGNLVRFCQGLARIRIQNKILVVLDNDTAGLLAFQRIRSLSLPRNMRVTLLPSLDEMSGITTLGPSGESVEDVNGKAVSIECFLDFEFGPKTPPAIRWTSFNPDLGVYQGELLNKEQYARSFFENSKDASYDLQKLGYLWDHLIRSCIVTDNAESAVFQGQLWDG
jgi:hypothetical protein